MGYTDSHFHILSMIRRGIDIPSALASITAGIDVAVDPEDIDERLPILQTHPHISYSVGAGPWCTDRPETISSIQTLVEKKVLETHPAAIGEIGLDKHWNYSTPERQRELFEFQMDLAKSLKLPVIIHDRDAHSETLEVLRAHKIARESIMHCFSGGPELAKACLDLGFSLAFGGNITYKGNHEIREALKITPPDRILWETDSPYLSPGPLRGTPNSPANIPLIASFAAELRGDDPESLNAAAEENLHRILKNSLSDSCR